MTDTMGGVPTFAAKRTNGRFEPTLALYCEGNSAPLLPHAPKLSSRESDNLKRKATPTQFLPMEHPAADMRNTPL